ncbi:popld domain-containing protein [Rutstroemia sp. NJR-2017a BVV2]|nr:popld domain-containing protein [Rutstroemia sp. NJR-2017a BVV2]
MPPQNSNGSSGPSSTKKRKDPPQSSSGGKPDGSKGRDIKRAKSRDARSIMTQTADTALNNGDLDLQAFLKAREFEIKALEDGMQKSKVSLSTRAFQQVPRDMRRRTASHNVKRVPKRLQKRAGREMKEDNTPTVKANKRKPRSSRSHIRRETAKKLGGLAEKKRASKGVVDAAGIITREARPKIRKNALNAPPKPKSKFRKRQVYKTWLPTHLWHAKRAKMTDPKNPLWRMAIPLTSNEKSYRPTHRASGIRGAVAWDVSYMSTIGLRGPIESLRRVLSAVGVPDTDVSGPKGESWRRGRRSWNGWLSKQVKDQQLQISPAVAFWDITSEETPDSVSENPIRQIYIRIHPAAFLETWNELLRLSKLQRPSIQIEDLRFEIGSIEITGPGSTEALLGILHPYHEAEASKEPHAQTFASLGGVTNPASLPANSILSFSIMDPRLRYPPRKITLPDPNDEDANFSLLETLSTWPADKAPASSHLFNRDQRYKATRLPSQKALNRRKALAPPGAFPSITERDPSIPIMLLTSRMTPDSSTQGSWTLLVPWKCVLPIWYGLVHYPLSSGGNPRFGGLQELRQIHFEHGVPWFPADYPGTNSGYAWEVDQREKRKRDWDKRPKGKRIEWKSVDLGGGKRGEVGLGWACDFGKVVGLPTESSAGQESTVASDSTQSTAPVEIPAPAKEPDNPFNQLTSKHVSSLLSSPDVDLPPSNFLTTIRVTLLSRGVATPCARIYRLPSSPLLSNPDSTNTTSTSTTSPTLRDQWLSLVPESTKSKPLPNSKKRPLQTRIPLNTPLPQRVRLLAQQLLQNPPLPYPKVKEEEDDYPIVPDEDDLIGFVTTGEYNLAEGKAVALGSVGVKGLVEGVRRDRDTDGKEGKEGRWCIVRNVGEKVGRLARWDLVR